MTDLHELPHFDIKPYTHLIHNLNKTDIGVSEILTSDPIAVAAKCPLPSADVKKLTNDIVQTLQRDVLTGVRMRRKATEAELDETADNALRATPATRKQEMISTLDPQFDKALGGGIAAGHVIEVVGPSASGKSTFVLNLLLAVQLPPPLGLGRASIFIGTEGRLKTTRLHQLLLHQRAYGDLQPQDQPSFDHVHAKMAKDLEEQEHIIRDQLPIAIQRYNAGLVVLDSVTANFRAEHGTGTAAQLAKRAVELTDLGTVLRKIAVEHQVCVVVVNQVADRWNDHRSLSPAITSSPATSTHNLPPAVVEHRQETQSLDHQQRFFTGWGDEKGNPKHEQMKTPALGLAWANQISARIVLKMESEQQEYAGGNIWKDKKRTRTFAVVFAPWAPPTNPPIRYEIAMQGLVSSPEAEQPKGEAEDDEHADLLDETLWATDSSDDEFP